MNEPNLQVRPLVVGASGLVGRRLTERLEARYPHTVSATRTELDITDRWRTEAEIERLQPTVVINCAATADVDGCERDPEQAMRVNAAGPANLAEACQNAGIRLIHLSTDYVFDGRKLGEYDEADAPNPLSVYARSKLAGEEAVLETLVDAVVLRVSFVFGPGRVTFIDKLAVAAVNHREAIPCVDGWITKPTYSDDLVRAIDEFLTADVTGVWHFACGPAVSRYEFARETLRLLGEDPARVTPVAPESLNLPAARPPRSPLSTRRFTQRFGRTPRPWNEWARIYLAEHPPERTR